MAKPRTLLTPGENETSPKIRPDIHASSCLPCFLLVQASFRARVPKTVKAPRTDGSGVTHYDPTTNRTDWR